MKIISSFSDMEFDKLLCLYGLDNAGKFYEAMELHDYLREDFFRVPGAFYAVIEHDNKYICALRSEPYKEGYLIEALQTDFRFRNQGYAKALLHAVVKECDIVAGRPLYAHVHKNNMASICVHRACGFQVFLDYAVFIDGSVSNQSETLILSR